MTRLQRGAIFGLAGGVGGGLGYAAGGGANDQGWFLGLVGFVGAMLLAVVNASSVEEVFEMGDQQLERFNLFLGVRIHPSPGGHDAS